jgi:hypothetical protein
VVPLNGPNRFEISGEQGKIFVRGKKRLSVTMPEEQQATER